MTLADPVVSVLGPDPSHRKCVLNGNAFQQDAIQSCHGWQYACFYSSLTGAGAEAGDGDGPGATAEADPLFVHLARRKLPRGQWEILVFDDYPQTTDDGHNTIQIGVCPGDGTIHLSYDHHCDVVRYRHSIPGIALTPEAFPWSTKLFTATLSHLPGLEKHQDLFGYITYPRFGPLHNASGDLWFSFRTGKAGLGDDHLCIYRAATGRYEPAVRTHLRGVDSGNPYVHGLHHRGNPGRLYATWVWRGFVAYAGWDDPADTQHKQQAGPNSAENNHDICFAYSEDEGRSWRNGAGEVIAGERSSIGPDSPGIVAFEIPKGSGLINQESQAVDHQGGVHVLNRDSLGGEQRWKHYYRAPDGTWSQRALPHVDGAKGGKRGQVAVSKDDDLYFVLPDTKTPVLTILKASRADGYATYELVWRKGGFPPTEPLVDTTRLDYDNVLSVYTRAVGEGENSSSNNNVVVLDFQL